MRSNDTGYKQIVMGIITIGYSIGVYAKPIELIKSVTITKHRVEVKVNDAFKKKYLRDDFFAEYDADIDLTQLDRSIVLMPFFMNVVSTVWISGDEYTIESMDAQLYSSLEKVRQVFKRLYPHTQWLGKLIPKQLVHNQLATKVQEHEVALMFSGGLDSIASSLYHRDTKQLLITARGHFDMPLRNDRAWLQMKHEICTFAKQYGHTNAFVYSNYWDLFNYRKMNRISPEVTNWHTRAIEGLGWAGLAAPILVTKGYSVLLVASSIDWDCPNPHAANPLVDDIIAFSGTRLQHDMFDFNRVVKQAYLADYYRDTGQQKSFIKVCQHRNAGASNCCRCEKCLRTIQGFIVVADEYQPYGFPISYQKAVDRLTKFYSTAKIPYQKVWHLTDMQRWLEEHKTRGNDLSDYLTWFAQLDLTQLMKDTRAYKHFVDWYELAEECKQLS